MLQLIINLHTMTDFKGKADEFPQFTATKGGANRTKAGRLRELFAEIEAAQAGGWNYGAIIHGLAEQGLEVSLHTLKSAMKRMRAARKQNAPSAESTPKKGALLKVDKSAVTPKAGNESKTPELHLSKDGYRNPMPTFQRDVTKRLNLDE